MIQVRLLGLDTLSLKVSYLTKAAALGLKLGTSEAAGLVEEEAKINCPVLTGRLQAAIHTEVVTNEPEVQLLAVAAAHPADNEYGIDPPYARRVHNGFIGTDKLGRNYHQAAQPYMTSARDAKEAEAIEAIKSAIYDQMDAAMSQVASRRVA